MSDFKLFILICKNLVKSVCAKNVIKKGLVMIASCVTLLGNKGNLLAQSRIFLLLK